MLRQLQRKMADYILMLIFQLLSKVDALVLFCSWLFPLHKNYQELLDFAREKPDLWMKYEKGLLRHSISCNNGHVFL